MASRRVLPIVFGTALAAQVALYVMTRDVRPTWDVLGPPPSEDALRLAALGEPQALYRWLALSLQNAGDTGGRMTPLKAYDYDHVVGWLERLDALDPRAQTAPALAAYYFGQTSDHADMVAIIRFLMRAVPRDPTHRWQYLAHGAYLARHRAGDLRLALEAAQKLARLPGATMPPWARQMPAFILADLGDREAAAAFMEAFLASADDLPPEEVNFIHDFLSRRVGEATDTPPAPSAQ